MSAYPRNEQTPNRPPSCRSPETKTSDDCAGRAGRQRCSRRVVCLAVYLDTHLYTVLHRLSHGHLYTLLRRLTHDFCSFQNIDLQNLDLSCIMVSSTSECGLASETHLRLSYHTIDNKNLYMVREQVMYLRVGKLEFCPGVSGARNLRIEASVVKLVVAKQSDIILHVSSSNRL